jgi:proteasome lid subunit RPN8/RPN11
VNKVAKNNKKKDVSKKNKEEFNENSLPQNILHIGSRVEENKEIYISQRVYKQIKTFTSGKTENESGGMLIGRVVEEFSKTNIIINGFVPAKYAEGTPTTLKFTHEDWEYCNKECESKFSGQKIVGWIHTHPDYGIFLSEYDKFVHENFFKEEYQIAYVVHPIQKSEGFYFWINENLVRCKGFYIFDKMGTKINVCNDSDGDAVSHSKSSSIKNVMLGFSFIVIGILLVLVLLLNSRVTKLENQMKDMQATISEQSYLLNQQILSFHLRLSGMESGEDDIAVNNTSSNQEETTEVLVTQVPTDGVNNNE